MRHTIGPMRIGIDCRLPTYRLGGISQSTLQLVQALAELPGNEQVTIFHSRKEGHDFTPADARFSRSDLWTPCHHRLERWALSAELTRHRLDVFHSPDFIPPAFGAGRRVITVHDLTFLHYPDFLTAESRRYYSDQIGWAVASADHIAADSEATRNDLIHLLGVAAGKVTTVPLAVGPLHTRDYAPEAIDDTLAQHGLSLGFILAVGTLEPRKNLPLLLRAYALLREKRMATQPLVLAGGKGWKYDEIFQTIDDLGLNEHVRHLSGLTDVAVAHLYRGAGVLAFPSRYEGFGLPALEAMHAGCPVVASNRGSLPEVVGEAGILLPPDDPAAWAEALARVLTDETTRDALRRAGRKQAGRFTWRRTAEAMLAIYRGA